MIQRRCLIFEYRVSALRKSVLLGVVGCLMIGVSELSLAASTGQLINQTQAVSTSITSGTTQHAAARTPPHTARSAKSELSVGLKQTSIVLEVGHAHILTLAGARQVAVGNSHTLQANAANASEVILFGKQAGTTTVDVWDDKGHRRSFQVEVRPAGREQVLEEIQFLLGDNSPVKVRSSGQHIVLEAETLSSSQRARIGRILGRYPEVLDMTPSMNWDPMVMMDVQVIELPRHRLQELGVRWQSGETTGLDTGVSWHAGQILADGVDSILSGGAQAVGWLGLGSSIQARLQSMADRGEAVLLAQPQLTTRTGKAATFLAGGEVPYAMTDEKGRGHTEFKKYGVALSVTPEIGLDERIVANVEVEVSSVDPSITTAAGPAMRMRKTSTEFSARAGETVVLAGFMSSEHAMGYQGAPTKKHAFFDKLTGVEQQQSNHTELVILVTPVIMNAQKPLMQDQVRKARAYADAAVFEQRRLTQSLDRSSGSDRYDPDESNGWEMFTPLTLPSQWQHTAAPPQ